MKVLKDFWKKLTREKRFKQDLNAAQQAGARVSTDVRLLLDIWKAANLNREEIELLKLHPALSAALLAAANDVRVSSMAYAALSARTTAGDDE